jgi:hypothetical protein
MRITYGRIVRIYAPKNNRFWFMRGRFRYYFSAGCGLFWIEVER